METTDDEFLVEAKRFIRDAVASGEPFFVWFNTTHMHFRTTPGPRTSAAAAAGSRNTTM